MLDFELRHTDQSLLEEFRHFALTVLRPYAGRADEIGDIPPELVDAPEVLNFMNAYIPLSMGGGWRSAGNPSQVHDVAASMKHRVMLNEEGGYGDASLFLAMPGPALTEPLLKAYGTPDQQSRYFKIFLSKKPKWSAFAMSEPDAGSDVAAIRTTATKKGSSYVLNGRKWFIGNAARADWVIVFATIDQTRGQFGLRTFLVDRGTPGFSVTRILPTMGLKALQVSELTFQDCEVPAENLLKSRHGRKFGGGIQDGLKTFSVFRPSVAATAMGIARAAIECLEDYIAQNGATHIFAHKWKAANERINELKCEINSVRLLYRKAAWLYDHGKDNNLEASMAKALGANVGIKVCIETMELAGKDGVNDELPLERLFRDIVAFDVLEGMGDIHRIMVASSLVRSLNNSN
jgi:acyl-CoA dehydrogenase